MLLTQKVFAFVLKLMEWSAQHTHTDIAHGGKKNEPTKQDKNQEFGFLLFCTEMVHAMLKNP